METLDYKNGRRKAPLDLSTMVYGKVPPQAKDLEEAVLGAVILEGRDAYDRAAEIIKPECFYVDGHQRIFRAAMTLAEKSRPIDQLTVVEQLRTTEELDVVGGPYYVSKLTNVVTSSAHIEYHSKIIYEKWLQREMIRLCGESINDAYEDATDAYQLLEDHERKLTEITTAENSSENMTPMDSALVQTIQSIEAGRANESHITGVPSGFSAIDDITHGWQKTDLIILAARPSVGKTALALNLATGATKKEKSPHVAFFSLEMSMQKILERMLSAESGIPLESIVTRRLEDWQMEKLFRFGVQPLADRGIHFDDTAALNIQQLRNRCRKLKRKLARENAELGLIIVDYLQLMSGLNEGRSATRAGNREQEISNISRSLKSLAKELNVPVIALSQLSREVEKRKSGEKMPQLSDLRESGAIEQDADVVCFIYRPEYYDINQNEMGESNTGETHIRIAKHRSGKLDTVKLTAQLHIQKFVAFTGESSFNAQSNWRPIGNLETNTPDDDPF